MAFSGGSGIAGDSGKDSAGASVGLTVHFSHNG
jgi:hypothetical protein